MLPFTLETLLNNFRATMKMPVGALTKSRPLLDFALEGIVSNKENTTAVFTFLLDLLQVPPSAYRFNTLYTPSLILLDQLLETIDAQHHGFMRLAHTRLFENMGRFVAPTRNPDNETDYPIYFFLLEFSPHPRPSFSHYGLACVRMLFQSDTAEARAARRTARSVQYDLGLSLRTFIENASSPNSQRLPLDPLPLETVYQAFAEAAPATLTSLSNNTIANKLACVLCALGPVRPLRGPQPGRLHSRHEDYEGKYDRIPSKVETVQLDEEATALADSVEIETTYDPMLREAAREGEHNEDYARKSIILPESFSQSPLGTIIYRRMLAQGTIAAQRKHYPWQRSTPPLAALAKLKYSSYGRPGEKEAALLIAGTGQTPNRVACLVWVSCLEEHPNNLALDPQLRALVYYRPHGWVGWEEVLQLPGCLPTSERIVIPLPAEIWTAISPFIAGRKRWDNDLPPDQRMLVFATPSRGPLTITAINEFLKSVDHRLSAPKLSTAFLRIGEGRLNLDPLDIAYISGIVPSGFNSQMFYRRITLRRLAVDYFTATALFHRFLDLEYTYLKSRDFRHAIEIEKYHRPSIPDWVAQFNLAYGSKVVPRKNGLRRFFRKFRRVLQEKSTDRDEIGRRLYINLLMTYLHLAFLFATGIRPFRDGNPSLLDFLLKSNGLVVLVGEKDNRRFRNDNRLIRLSSLAVELYQVAVMATSDHAAALHAGKWGVHRPIYELLARANWPLFFLLDEEDRPVNPAPKTILILLRSVNLEDLFQVPMNAGRHLHMTHTFEMRVHHTIAEQYYGHQRDGHEFLSKTATTDIERAHTIMNHGITTLMRQIDLLPTRYHKLD